MYARHLVNGAGILDGNKCITKADDELIEKLSERNVMGTNRCMREG